MIRARCCEWWIKPGQNYVKRDVETGSAALYLHARCRQAAEHLAARRTLTP
ncbi:MULTISPECIES: hypothetical protein [unclassified Streptomyces]|uniref:hypothetical protein n=1 Tax=unclassified Streptomyces TaxID=2593676 RepID=UPI003D8E4716